ncbi:DUF447 domain-containing protein [Halegenticoccus tardaugens]|uniref:DUF447 domain-containing protein n=1 Tax=Halegenticoccus tardaugens TaxID=2071624 RepID=UPI00100AB291|nr:DUF447 domain-containing protein [Halegenticoccus tardaugens]
MSGDDSVAAGAAWPVDLRGVTESVVATLGPNGRWNVAALGLRAPAAAGELVTATTWGNTRTRRNFHRRGGGVVQFTSDPREFVDAALTIREEDEPVLPGADAWVEVRATRVESDDVEGTRRERWELDPIESAVLRERVPTINRGLYAVIDATVAASRLDVPSYDADALLDRLAYFEETVRTCGGPAEVEAFERLGEITGWRERRRAREEHDDA